MHIILRIALGLVALAAVSCSTNTDAVGPDTGADLGSDQGPDACVRPPGSYPLKVLFLIDTSGSMQFTDPSSQATTAEKLCLASCSNYQGLDCPALCKRDGPPGRRTSVAKVIEMLRSNPNASFATIAFNHSVHLTGDATDEFTNAAPHLDAALASLMEASATTDLQSALAAAKRLIDSDAAKSTADLRSRTKYVVVLLSDGKPNPVCKEGCDNDVIDFGTHKVPSWCDVERDKWCSTFPMSNCAAMQSWYPEMTEACRPYNTEQQLLALVDEIAQLEVTHGIAEVRLHAALLFDTRLPKTVLDLFYDPSLTIEEQRQEMEDLVKKLAAAGGGVYWRFGSGRSIDFIDPQHLTLFEPYTPCAPIAP
jgi:hypothetical protein